MPPCSPLASPLSIQSIGRRTFVKITKLELNSTVYLRLKIWTTNIEEHGEVLKKWPFHHILDIFLTQNYG